MEKVFRIIRFDLSTCWKSIATLLGFYFIFGLYYGCTIGDLQVIPISIMIWISMMAGIPFALREKYFLNNLLGSFPVNRRNIVRSGYLLTLSIGVIGIAMSEIMILISSGVFRIGFSIKEMYFVLCIGVILYSLIMAIHIPLYLRFNHSLAILISPLFLYFCYILGCQLYYFGMLSIDLSLLIAAVWRFFAFSLAGTVFLAAAMFFISYIIACRVYINKDL